ncbi:MAG: hypothetical protein ACI9XC_002328 [Gammaproteobacteria bacterium]|jgi:hypothetical protein
MQLNYIICPSFHGATLLSLLLNNHSGISCIGDTFPSQKIDQLCSCGEKISRCAQWREVKQRMDIHNFSHYPYLLPDYPELINRWSIQRLLNMTMVPAEGRVWQLRIPSVNHFINSIIGLPIITIAPWLWRTEIKGVEQYSELFNIFYKIIMDLHDTKMFIDCSKRLGRILALHSGNKAREITKVIHICRDPRGFATSWERNVGKGGIYLSSQLWLDMHMRIANTLAATQGIEVMLLRYEDICINTTEVMNRVFNFFGIDNELVVSGPVSGKKHHMIGNRMLFKFDGDINEDISWKEKLSDKQQHTICKVTEPLFSQYGYQY